MPALRTNVRRFFFETKISALIGAITDGFHDIRWLRKISFRRSSNSNLPLPDGAVLTSFGKVEVVDLTMLV